MSELTRMELEGLAQDWKTRAESSEATLAGVPIWVFDSLLELERAKEKFPDQHLPDGTANDEMSRGLRDFIVAVTNAKTASGTVTWRDILNEEVCEAFAETEWRKLRAELVQVIAMAVRWIEDGDAREENR